MKKNIFLVILLALFATSIYAQNDTMYVMKNGEVVGKYNVNTDVDSIIFYKPIIQETSSGVYTDTRDGNVYSWVKIGNQVWMSENLAYLPSVNKVADGSEIEAGSYFYVYDYNGTNVAEAKATSNYATYGVLYNWAAAMGNSVSSFANPSGVQGVCPNGWHLPSDAEWTELTDYLGGITTTSGKLKEAGTTHWETPNTEATNETNFTALPGGDRNVNGNFINIQSNGFWWSATENHPSSAFYRNMFCCSSNVNRSFGYKELGFSIRCVKD